MNEIEQTLQHVGDRDTMIRLVEQISEDGVAILVTRDAGELRYWYLGKDLMLWDLTGLLGAAQAKLQFNHFARQADPE